MMGDLYATGVAGSGPLPPAFSQRPLSAREPAAGDERMQPPFFPRVASPAGAPRPQPAGATTMPFDAPPAPPTAAPSSSAPIVSQEGQSPIRPQVPFSDPKRSGFGGLPSEAVFLPDAAIPHKEPKPQEEREPAHADISDPRRRPVSASDLAVLVAARLELFARRLRERGSQGLAESFSGDALDLALAGLISGYIAGRGG